MPPATVVVSGSVSFDRIPVVAGSNGGLDYAATGPAPAQGVTVEFIEGDPLMSNSGAFSTTSTDAAGRFSLQVPSATSGFLRVRAEMVSAGQPGWDVAVVDNTNLDALYALDGAVFDTGDRDSVRDLHAGSGWTGAGYGGERAAAPFAILDTIRKGMDLLVSVDSTIVLSPLALHWSVDNIPSPASGGVNTATGEIVTTFFSEVLGGVYVLGAENSDTDEYDEHVLLHEWAHYLEAEFARSDTIGGPHALGDVLDLRVAFSEGWANAFAAIATNESLYRDALGPAQGAAPAFDVEGSPLPIGNPAPGWFSEQSVHEMLFDLFDAAADGADALELGFGPVFAVLGSGLNESSPPISIFSFIALLKAAETAAVPSIDAIVTAQSMDPVADIWGTGETNDAGAQFSSDVLPVFTELTPNGPAINVCSTDEFSSAASGLVNKLATRRLVRFDMPTAGDIEISMTATSIPAGEASDPDFVLHRAGRLEASESAPTAACSNVAAAGWSPADCSEVSTFAVEAGAHVIEAYEFSNTQSFGSAVTPIGRTCFDISVTIQ